MYKNKKIIIPIVIIALLGGIFYVSQVAKKDRGETNIQEQFSYEILDDGVIQDDSLKAWVNDNLPKEGLYTETFENNTYVLVSAGSDNKKGHGIELTSIEDKKDSVDIKYEIIDSDSSTTDEDRIPHMILRVNGEYKINNISE